MFPSIHNTVLESGWLASGRFAPGKDLVFIVQEAGWDSRSFWAAWKFLPTPR
jgi:hypothetical protein